MSHEIRTPLNAVIGFAEALEVGVNADEPDKRRETLQIISSAGRQLNNLIGDILDFAKIDAGKFEVRLEETLVSEVFLENLPIIQHMLDEKGVTLKRIKNADKRVLVDRYRLTQILLNFVSNAAKYNCKGGKVELGCFEVPKNEIRIYVKDTGIGIPELMKNRIFMPFERVRNYDRDIAGAGLGLSICKRLTEEMRGKIGFESNQDQGSTFWVQFPVV